MRFGTCPVCNVYKYLDSRGFCIDCLKEKQHQSDDSELIDLIKDASMKPEDIINKLNE